MDTVRDSSSVEVTVEVLMYLLHHVFLIPKLPGKDDFDPAMERVLLNIVCDALQFFRDIAEPDQHGVIERVIVMIDNLRRSQDESGAINDVQLEDIFREISERGTLSQTCKLR